MSEDSDPISDSTPNKRRKITAKAWDSQDDSGEEFTADDFNTIATIPLETQRQLGYTADQLHSDLRTSQSRTYITQPTQALTLGSQAQSKVQVARFSPPVASPPPKPAPQPIRRAFQKPGILAGAFAPAGTVFRAPAGAQTKPSPVAIAVAAEDSDSDGDPPVHHSSDDEPQTQGFRSNLKPTAFTKGGRGLDSTPNRSEPVVQESPRPAAEPINAFRNILSEFNYDSSRAPSDSISAYANSSRIKPQQARRTSQVPPSTSNAVIYNTIEDIHDYTLRRKVLEIQAVLEYETVQRCMDALKRKHGSVADAQDWLITDEEQDAPGEEQSADELSSNSPAVLRRGVATTKDTTSSAQALQPVRLAAKQQVHTTLTIAEKYRRTSQMDVVDESPMSPDLKPRRRLIQGRKSARTTPTPTSSPPPQQPEPEPEPRHRLKKRPAVLEDDSDSESTSDRDVETEPIQVVESADERRLLKFFNECSLEDLVDLSSEKDGSQVVLDRRPFTSLDDIRALSNTTKKSKARPVGDKIVETCSEVLAAYDAVDELVAECERIARPIQDALKGWGSISSENEGQIQLTNLDHDSGIGTPASSSEEPASTGVNANRTKGFLSQPSSMSSDFTLKDYQLVGLNWLDLLWSKKLSCILADEMGLGKTCQVISFLAHLQELQVDGVHLVIVPGSTLENWLREFGKFAPKLRILPYYGDQKERAELRGQIEAEFGSIDVIVTTIDIAVKDRDNEFLRRHVDPLVCIFDEGHALKNIGTNRYKMLSQIPATFRILLTGTPLQNNLQELIAILAFIMPDLFKTKREELQYIFKHKATTKDVSNNNPALLSAQRIVRARSMMTPFVLRRRKENVLELPPKTNHVEYCDMLPIQAEQYEGLIQTFLTDTKKRSSNILMALRQAALHPLLRRRIFDDNKIDKITTEMLKDPAWAHNGKDKIKAYLLGVGYEAFNSSDIGLHRFCQSRNDLRKFELKKRQWMDAGKVVKFQELVEGFKANGDRVLVFSQFTTMMDILEAVLETLKIKFMRIDGSTSVASRQDMLDHFTNDESITVFMLSTKAGGQGINLPCANKVIIFDSGFNPQDDIQAENRAHRVGQTRPVDVYRLVTRGTIEEQIHAMGQYKLELGERVAEGSSAGEEKAGEQMVAKMLVESLQKKEGEGEDDDDDKAEAVEQSAKGVDLKDAFKSGLEGSGLTVSSKQALF